MVGLHHSWATRREGTTMATAKATLLQSATDDLRAAQLRVDDILGQSTRALLEGGFTLYQSTDPKRVEMWNAIVAETSAGEPPP